MISGKFGNATARASPITKSKESPEANAMPDAQIMTVTNQCLDGGPGFMDDSVWGVLGDIWIDL